MRKATEKVEASGIVARDRFGRLCRIGAGECEIPAVSEGMAAVLARIVRDDTDEPGSAGVLTLSGR